VLKSHTQKELGALNRIVHQLDPGSENPRNSEGSFVTLADKTILFAYSRFTTSGGDFGSADIAAIYSHDAGETWSSDPQIIVRNAGGINVMSVSLVRLQDGRIALFYLVKNSGNDCRPCMRTSTDEGRSWSTPISVIPTPGYFVVNNDRVVQLKSGRLVIPAAFHRQKTVLDTSWKAVDSRSIMLAFLSDDAGATWRESRSWWALPVPSNSGLQEPGCVELTNGHLYGYCRTDTGYQWTTVSRDGGDTWSPPEPTRFISPNSPLSVKRLPPLEPGVNGHLLAVWNDKSPRFGSRVPPSSPSARSPLVNAISEDEGRTWRHHRLLENDPDSGYCYTALHMLPDACLLAYCAGSKATGSILNTLRIRRVDYRWLYGT